MFFLPRQRPVSHCKRVRDPLLGRDPPVEHHRFREEFQKKERHQKYVLVAFKTKSHPPNTHIVYTQTHTPPPLVFWLYTGPFVAEFWQQFKQSNPTNPEAQSLADHQWPWRDHNDKLQRQRQQWGVIPISAHAHLKPWLHNLPVVQSVLHPACVGVGVFVWVGVN